MRHQSSARMYDIVFENHRLKLRVFHEGWLKSYRNQLQKPLLAKIHPTVIISHPSCTLGVSYSKRPQPWASGHCVWLRSRRTRVRLLWGLGIVLCCIVLCCIVLYWWSGHCCPMHCDLFEIYCASPNLGIRTWICWVNLSQRPIAVAML